VKISYRLALEAQWSQHFNADQWAIIHVENCEPYQVGLSPRLFKTAYRFLIVYALFLGFEQFIIETVTPAGNTSAPLRCANWKRTNVVRVFKVCGHWRAGLFSTGWRYRFR